MRKALVALPASSPSFHPAGKHGTGASLFHYEIKNRKAEQMNIENKYKIEEAASKDPTRYILQGVHVANVNGSAKAVATDGRILAMVPVEIEPEDTVGVTARAETFKRARKAYKKQKISFIKLNGKATVRELDGEVSFDYVDGNYPNFSQVIPKPTEKTFKLSFDVNNLVRLWKALGGEDAKQLGVTLTVGHDGSAVDVNRPVEVTVDGQGYGLLMQMRKS